jgi:4-diphosphocytidyl-2-C-methyl-D-erythritol kinase
VTSLAVRAHAKINLDLRVLGRRPDGFHELRTVFQSLALHDRVVFRARPGPFAIESSDSALPLDQRNLVWRAAQKLWSAAGRGGDLRGVRVSIDKRIPSQAGLGGGSSDAAATLVALDTLWRTRMGPAALVRLAAAIGADVAFFLMGGTALGLGRGELLYPLPDLPSMGVVLVHPGFGVATADAYQWYAEGSRPQPPGHAQGLAVPWLPGPLEIGNDLEAPVMARHPGIVEVRRALLRRGAEVALMSGSGSTVFGLFGTVDDARRAAGRLRGPGWHVLVTRTLGRAAFRRSLRPAR